ncbi:hypothetical protein [Natronococcus wangiae]|uniref:hypothetical protein n=1 Tax=Natronococcus wangiae TaxID=3068275 RepID=UPI00273F9208|nr:hypothetical protein [Natronococcus sp. AD5]
MSQDDAQPRRRILRVAAVTVVGSTAAVAGCTDQGEEPGDEPEAEEGTGNGQEREGEDGEGERILLETDGDVWIGQEPAEIEDEENPTLELVAGWEYEIGCVNRDGDDHSLALWADGEERDATGVDDEEGEEQWLTVEGSDDLTSYRCEVHPDTMEGDIEVDE